MLTKLLALNLGAVCATYHDTEYWSVARYNIPKPMAWKGKTASGGRYYEKNTIKSPYYLSSPKDKRTWQGAAKQCDKLKRKLAQPKNSGDYLRIRARIPPINDKYALTWVGFNDIR